ncbi:IS150 conserved protein InsB [Escherichia coli]|uniref:IS150 conserved protein InsB n=1 Tax=Escherichia coli TaxID=562 RepID=A0A2X1KPH3_ECOLX|nr:IS150 conserved protein InsB [Escherichia coli]
MNMVENMLDQAFKKLNPHEHPVLHSDQGWQYRMRRYQNILKEHGINKACPEKAIVWIMLWWSVSLEP